MLELAIDLRSYLENRVVRAYETGALAETRKWVGRNKPLALAVAAGILALAELNRGEAVTAAGLAEERRIQADHSAEEARRQARINEEVNRFLNDDLLGALGARRR